MPVRPTVVLDSALVARFQEQVLVPIEDRRPWSVTRKEVLSWLRAELRRVQREDGVKPAPQPGPPAAVAPRREERRAAPGSPAGSERLR